jgi:hypothetical protein
MKIQCLIEREGVTSITHAGHRFDFVPNKKGDYVCEISNPGTVAYLMGFMGGTWYREYIEELEIEDNEDIITSGFINLPDGFIEKDFIETKDITTDTPSKENLDTDTLEKTDMKAKYESFTKKADIQKACLEDFKVELDPRLSLDRMKKKVFSLI